MCENMYVLHRTLYKELKAARILEAPGLILGSDAYDSD
jgi:hypothetical protein